MLATFFVLFLPLRYTTNRRRVCMLVPVISYESGREYGRTIDTMVAMGGGGCH